MQLKFMPDPLKDAAFEAVGKINVGNFDSDKPVLIGGGNLPQGPVSLDGGEQFQIFLSGDKIILELSNVKRE